VSPFPPLHPPETEICHANADGRHGRRRQGEATLAEQTKAPEKSPALQCALPVVI